MLKLEETLSLSVLNTIECEHTKDKPLMICAVIGDKGEVIKNFTEVYSVSGELTVLSAPYKDIVWIKPIPTGRFAKVLVKRRPQDSTPREARGAFQLEVV